MARMSGIGETSELAVVVEALITLLGTKAVCTSAEVTTAVIAAKADKDGSLSKYSARLNA